MKIVNEALDHVRRDEQAGYILLKKTIHPADKSIQIVEKAAKKQGILKYMNLKAVRAYNIKLNLQMYWIDGEREAAVNISDIGISWPFIQGWNR